MAGLRALIIGETEKAAIRAAVESARKRPVLFSAVRAGAIKEDKPVVSLGERKPGFERPASEHVLIPMGYRAAISFEQQPAGMCRHLSISVDTPGRIPNEPAVAMIAKEFGFDLDNPNIERRTWLEEFDPGHYAVNILQLDRPTPEGHA